MISTIPFIYVLPFEGSGRKAEIVIPVFHDEKLHCEAPLGFVHLNPF